MQTSTFCAEFTALNKAVKDSVMIRYHLISMGVKVYKPIPVSVKNMSVELNSTNHGNTQKNKTLDLSYHLIMENVANNFV